MQGPTLFISDLHLNESAPHITAAFERFINEHALQARALYILGDFFEAWVGDDDDSEFIRHIKSLLKRVTSHEIPVYFMRGNRDFFLGKRFCRETGMTFLPDPTVIELNGERILLTHGDYLCTDDVAHQKFRKYADNKFWRALFLMFPLKCRYWAAKTAREKSQARYARHPHENGDDKKPNITDVNQTTVENWLQKFNVLTIIHGHTHRPATHEFTLNGKSAKRIVLNAWDENYGFFSLISTADQQKTQ